MSAPVSDKTLFPRVARELDDRGIELAEFTLRKPSLDEVFFALTGHRADSLSTEGSGPPDPPGKTPTRELEETR